MSRIVIITCFNNKQMLEQMKNSVYKESGISEKECKIFAIDNTKNKFSSAAKAYNYALRHVTKAEVLVFLSSRYFISRTFYRGYYSSLLRVSRNVIWCGWS